MVTRCLIPRCGEPGLFSLRLHRGRAEERSAAVRRLRAGVLPDLIFARSQPRRVRPERGFFVWDQARRFCFRRGTVRGGSSSTAPGGLPQSPVRSGGADIQALSHPLRRNSPPSAPAAMLTPFMRVRRAPLFAYLLSRRQEGAASMGQEAGGSRYIRTRGGSSPFSSALRRSSSA